MKWLTNTHNPKDKNAMHWVVRKEGETHEEAWQRKLNWLKDKIIGEPEATKATKTHTVEELKAMNMVGVYVEEDKKGGVK